MIKASQKSKFSLIKGVCTRSFKIKQALINHLRQYHLGQSVNKENCKMKEKDYYGKETLKIMGNENVQVGKGEFICPKCKKVFKYNQTLLNHMIKRHKDFSLGEDLSTDNFCKTCDKQFKSRLTFRTHVRSFHEGPFKIRILKYVPTFKLQRHLNRHNNRKEINHVRS